MGRKKKKIMLKTRVVVNFHLDADYRRACTHPFGGVRLRCDDRRRVINKRLNAPPRQTINAFLHVNQQWKWQWKNGNLKQFQWQKLIPHASQSLCERTSRETQIICYNKKKARRAKNPFGPPVFAVECPCSCSCDGWCDSNPIHDSDVISVCRICLLLFFFGNSHCQR